MRAPPDAPAETPPPARAAPRSIGPRAALALRRSRRFLRFWGIGIGTLVVAALVIPISGERSGTLDRARLGRLAADTLRAAQRLRQAEAELAAAESLLIEARRPRPTSPVRTVERPAVRPSSAAAGSDPTLSAFATLIDEARRVRTVATWLAVADHPAVSAGPRMRSLADSIRTLEARLADVPAGPDRDAQVSALRQRLGRYGYTVLAIADNRRRELAAAGVTAVAPAPPPVAAPTTGDEPPVAVTDTLPLLARADTARAALATAQQAHDSVSAVLRAQLTLNGAAAEPGGSRSLVPAILLVVLLVAGGLVRFGAALRAELAAPTIAGTREAEEIARARVLTHVRAPMLDGPARFRPSGVDPFRLLYLGLTATGTRARSAIVTGSDPVIAAAAGARLAIAAAADHRNTLIVDLDPAHVALARIFRERAEPGATDALARAFQWREVARPVGSSDGLPITMIPAGTERDDLPVELDGELLEAFARFRAHFELAIVVTAPSRLAIATAVLEGAPVLLTAVVGETPLSVLAASADAIRSAGRKLLGVVLWDAPPPALPSRAELAALLSKRKGRTPGGSFEAVQRAIGQSDGSNKKPL